MVDILVSSTQMVLTNLHDNPGPNTKDIGTYFNSLHEYGLQYKQTEIDRLQEQDYQPFVNNVISNLHDKIPRHQDIGLLFCIRPRPVTAGCREYITIERILSLSIGSIPTSLFHEDCTMIKHVRPIFCLKIEAEAVSQHQLAPYDRSATALIRNEMALVQLLNVKTSNTFGYLALHFIQNKKSCITNAGTVVAVLDRYDIKLSITSKSSKETNELV
ncbi:unnamed protein product [Mytilus coruscus]|uniref:Uncharacterized protein n=1 Tax=Mytilus coruscus TaxID=42192 RepID=A0A6J8AG40_MYTCO|nr:unnamed protein product [Mytilus coruscus]